MSRGEVKISYLNTLTNEQHVVTGTLIEMTGNSTSNMKFTIELTSSDVIELYPMSKNDDEKIVTYTNLPILRKYGVKWLN